MQDKKIRTLTGLVTGKSGSKSVKVRIDYRIRHPKYGKTIRKQTRLAVHDEKNQSNIGDIVEITACRPRSKTKRWSVLKIVEKASQE
jgi:small subunit ribosomal protein S17